MTGRDGGVLLHNPDAERGVIGGMMLSADAIGEAVDVVAPRDFYEPRNETIFSLIVAMYSAQKPVDAVTLVAELAREGELAKVGGAPYVFQCQTAVPTAANTGYYAQLVAETAVRRRFVAAGERIRNMGTSTDDHGDVLEMHARAYDELDAVLSTAKPAVEGVARTWDNVLAGLENPDSVPALRTGLRTLDALYRGAAPGRLDVIGARPGIGKSVLAALLLREWAIRQGHTVLVFSLEMSAEEIMQRVMAAEARVFLHRITDPVLNPLTDADWANIGRVTPSITTAPIHIVDRPTGLADITRHVREHVRKGIKPAVIVDFLQLMLQPPRAESRQIGVAANVEGLKHIGREYGIPVVCLSQLNRNPDKRGDGVPRLSDLRDTGAIEQAADSVILIHRPEAEDPESTRKGEADLILAKQRNGRTGVATVAFQGHYAQFNDFG